MIAWRFAPLGEAALLVEATPADELANRMALALAQAIDRAAPPGFRAAIPGVSSLLLPFDPLEWSHERVEQFVRERLRDVEPLPAAPARILEIGVRYGGDDGPDLDDVAAQLALTPRDVVALHVAPVYRVMIIGFAPGFPYLGPLPAALVRPRRATPRTAVPAGSVAIAAEYSGIYPAQLPGGWHLLGRTETALFDPHADPPSLLQPGDGVRFVPLPDGVCP